MAQSLLIYGVIGALLAPGQSDLISVCVEDDEDLRVDCRIDPKLGQIDSYEFSWTVGPKESVINTNVSGQAIEARFRDRSYVEELEPHGYRMTLTGFTDTLPHNTTFMCKMSKVVASVYTEREQLLPCAAVSVFANNPCRWIIGLLLFFCHTHRWS